MQVSDAYPELLNHNKDKTICPTMVATGIKMNSIPNDIVDQMKTNLKAFRVVAQQDTNKIEELGK